ncbi:LysR family transcriptional regulator [Bifidobacterium sp. SMB2]|uniref:LysR family transcriptional regulator n=1 Tax=Bifidobacterium saimiriisciurei TaxID=2661627 RepID=A0ABX0CD39_9BIFI|nr:MULTISPECIES: LysR family transcriptional regulator [Bifidobacterium]NEG96619.1 LysR family transcriptional regulator [Bifidobacterium sp. SMB2]NEH12402.1 LysR family transcriptional regulator [Bifidobacterium saimiriisciurei]
MYDRRLDAILAAAELGSFSRAAAKLHISTPALIKQVNGFEQEHRITLFHRGRGGVRLTEAGGALAADAYDIIEESDRALRHARRLESGGASIRVGVSLLRPATALLDLWPRMAPAMAAHRPSIRLELVPLSDAPDGFLHEIDHLGDAVDVVVTGFSRHHWSHPCQVLQLAEYQLCMGVPLSNPLAGRARLTLDDLSGQRVHLPPLGDGDVMDEARRRLATNPGIELVDLQRYEFDVFNECAQSGDLLLAKSIWSNFHPSIRLIAMDWDITVPYGLLYAEHPAPVVRDFVAAVAELTGGKPRNP